MKKYGFFGGSFNPPTIAHEIIAKEIAKEFNLDKVYFVPVGDFYNKKDLIDERKRFEMLNLITDSNIDVLDIELKAKKSLQTIDAFNFNNLLFSIISSIFFPLLIAIILLFKHFSAFSQLGNFSKLSPPRIK